MSTRAALIALLVALGLGIAAWLTLSPRRAAPPQGVVPVGDKAIDFDPALAESLRVTHPDARSETLERDRASGAWRVVLHSTDGAGPGDGVAWPVVASRARAALRLLADARVTAQPEPDASIGEDPTSITLTFDDGASRTLRLAQRTLGGNGLIEIDPSPSTLPDGPPSQPLLAIVGDTVHQAFTNPGPRAWRDPAVFAGLGGGDGNASRASRVRIESPQGVLALARTEGRWRVLEPAPGPANESEVATLLNTLDSLAIADFLDGRPPPADPADAGFDRPTASITLEADRRGIDAASSSGSDGVTVTTDRRQVVLGGASDTGGTRLFASLGDGRPIVAVDAAGLAQLKPPTAYLAAPSSPVEAADVGALSFTVDPPASGPTPPATRLGASYRRGLDGWAEILPGGAESLLAESDVTAVMDVLDFLTRRPAAQVLTTPPAEYRRLGQSTLSSLADSPLDILEIGAAAQGSLIVRSGEVYRVYPADRLPRLFGRYSDEAQRTAAPPVGGPNDPTK